MLEYNQLVQNTFGIPVRAAAYAGFSSVEELRTLLSDSSLPRPFLFVGAGSNLLFTGDFPGTVFHSEMKGIRIVAGGASGSEGTSCTDGTGPVPGAGAGDCAASGEVLVEADAGVVFDDFCAWAAERGLWGVENLSHIPGEVGAGAVQNVGAYGVEAKDVIASVNCIEISTGKAFVFSNSDCGYGYRASNFKTAWKGRYAVTSVLFRLSGIPTPHLDYGHLRAAVEAKAADAASASQSVADGSLNSTSVVGDTSLEQFITPGLIRETVTGIRRQKLPEPSELGSAGSFFKNPVVPQEHYERILSDFRKENGPEATVPHYLVEQGESTAPMVKIPAAWMIEQCGWKGKQVGNVACYARQPLVIVNLTGKATAAEIISLEQQIISSVKARFGIELHPEVEHI